MRTIWLLTAALVLVSLGLALYLAGCGESQDVPRLFVAASLADLAAAWQAALGAGVALLVVMVVLIGAHLTLDLIRVTRKQPPRPTAGAGACSGQCRDCPHRRKHDTKPTD